MHNCLFGASVESCDSKYVGSFTLDKKKGWSLAPKPMVLHYSLQIMAEHKSPSLYPTRKDGHIQIHEYDGPRCFLFGRDGKATTVKIQLAL